MKRIRSSLIHVAANYRLAEIFWRSAKEFEEADTAKNKADQEFKRTKQAPWLVHSALERRTETGVVLLMSATALLEQIINDYAFTFLDPDSYEKHLGNLRIVTRWLLLPRLCQNKEISEDDTAINNFRELVKARNAIVHHKRIETWPNLGKSQVKVSTEIARFLSACRKATSTVSALIKILESPPPGTKASVRT